MTEHKSIEGLKETYKTKFEQAVKELGFKDLNLYEKNVINHLRVALFDTFQTDSSLDKLLGKFNIKFGVNDDWDNQLYQKTPSGWVIVNKTVLEFFLPHLNSRNLTMTEAVELSKDREAEGKRIKKQIQRDVLERFVDWLPKKFWEDEDHAVGGYISKRDLKAKLDEFIESELGK